MWQCQRGMYKLWRWLCPHIAFNPSYTSSSLLTHLSFSLDARVLVPLCLSNFMPLQATVTPHLPHGSIGCTQARSCSIQDVSRHPRSWSRWPGHAWSPPCTRCQAGAESGFKHMGCGGVQANNNHSLRNIYNESVNNNQINVYFTIQMKAKTKILNITKKMGTKFNYTVVSNLH